MAIVNPLVQHYGRTWWAPKVVKEIGKFVESNERVLDIGAGGGWTGELIAKKKQADVTLLDVADFNQTALPLVQYNGTDIPFEKESFDTSMLLFVLHHCQDPLAVFKEAVRVSKKRIIVFEDTFTSPFQRFTTCVNDFFTNFHFFITNPFAMNMPYNYRRIQDWERVFKEHSLEVKYRRVMSGVLTKHVLFVLEKC